MPWPNWSPKKCRQNGSFDPGKFGADMFFAVMVVTILTTPGATFFTTGAKLPEGKASRATGASSILMEASVALTRCEGCVNARAEAVSARVPAKARAVPGLRKDLKSVFMFEYSVLRFSPILRAQP